MDRIQKGLGQFNGYTLKTYTHLPDDSTSLPGNEILQIIEDSSRQIWVLTHKGLARYDRHSDTFHTIKEKMKITCLPQLPAKSVTAFFLSAGRPCGNMIILPAK